jgi:tripartite-type tricarboxylate transporter receptor subunit TctC
VASAGIGRAKSRRALLAGAVATFAAPLASPAIVPGVARAQGGWPARPIRCIVPLPPGGGTDAMGRRAMQRLSEVLGVPVVVDNRPGAGGTIGSEVVAQAAPDGYTIGIATASSHAAAPVFRRACLTTRSNPSPPSPCWAPRPTS